jgi:hypothetical protein
MENKNVLVGVVIVFLLLMVSLINFGADLKDRGVLDAESESYLDKTTGKFNSSGFLSVSNSSELVPKEKNPLIAKLENVPILSDVLGLTNFLIDATSGVFDVVKVIYNIPSFVVEGLGLPLGAFKTQINIIGIMLAIGIIVMFIQLVK